MEPNSLGSFVERCISSKKGERARMEDASFGVDTYEFFDTPPLRKTHPPSLLSPVRTTCIEEE